MFVKKLFKNIAPVITYGITKEYLPLIASLGILILDPSECDEPINSDLYHTYFYEMVINIL